MYSPASPGALSPDVPFPVSLSRASRASVTNVGDRRENVGRLAFYRRTSPSTKPTHPKMHTHNHAVWHCVTFRYTLNLLYFVRAASGGAAGASLGVTSSSAPGAARRFD